MYSEFVSLWLCAGFVYLLGFFIRNFSSSHSYMFLFSFFSRTLGTFFFLLLLFSVRFFFSLFVCYWRTCINVWHESISLRLPNHFTANILENTTNNSVFVLTLQINVKAKIILLLKYVVGLHVSIVIASMCFGCVWVYGFECVTFR